MADEKKLPPHKSLNSIIIRDLSFHCNEQHLIDLFHRAGVTWSHLKVERGEKHNHSLLHAFVETNTPEEAVHLINTLQGTKLIGRVMKLQLCKDSQGHGNAMTNIIAMPTGSIEAEKSRYQIHVKYQSQATATPQGKVTEETIEQLFHQYGEIEDVVVKRHHEEYDQFGNIIRQNGYGFLYYKHPESSFYVVEKLPQLVVNNTITFTCCFSYKAAETITHKTPPHQSLNHSSSNNGTHHAMDNSSSAVDDRIIPPPLVPNYFAQPGFPPNPNMPQQIPDYFVMPPMISPRDNHMNGQFLPPGSMPPLPPPMPNHPPQPFMPNPNMLPPNMAFMYPPNQAQFFPRNMSPNTLPPGNMGMNVNMMQPPNQAGVMYASGPSPVPPVFNMSGSISPASTPSTPSPPPSTFPQHYANAMNSSGKQDHVFARGIPPPYSPPPQQPPQQPGMQLPPQPLQYQQGMNQVTPLNHQGYYQQQPPPPQQLQHQQPPHFQYPPRPNRSSDRDQQYTTSPKPHQYQQQYPPHHQQPQYQNQNQSQYQGQQGHQTSNYQQQQQRFQGNNRPNDRRGRGGGRYDQPHYHQRRPYNQNQTHDNAHRSPPYHSSNQGRSASNHSTKPPNGDDDHDNHGKEQEEYDDIQNEDHHYYEEVNSSSSPLPLSSDYLNPSQDESNN